MFLLPTADYDLSIMRLFTQIMRESGMKNVCNVNTNKKKKSTTQKQAVPKLVVFLVGTSTALQKIHCFTVECCLCAQFHTDTPGHDLHK